MDHFSLPKGKAHLQIPNLTLEAYTCGDGGFENYPARKGWTPEEVAGQNSFGGRSRQEVQSFFQNWLYFGCATEVLAIAGVGMCQSDLLDETGHFLSTRRLPRLIRQWRSNVRRLGGKSTGTHIDWAMKTARILKRVSDFVDSYCLPYYGVRAAAVEGLGGAHSPVSELTWVSIIALGHTLGEAMLAYYGIVRTGNNWGASRLLKRHLLDNGWCPMDVERSMTDMGIDGHYYLSQMKRPESHISHAGCTVAECRARNVDKETYRQKHVRETNDCGGAVKADVVSVIQTINLEGHIPVFRWNSREKRLEMESSRMIRRGVSDPPFVTISHVWSDRMGNLTENSLLECQLDRIQNAVLAVAKSGKVKGRSPRHFWLDTLCVPVGVENRKVRREAIRKMADTYKAASAVLVLSSTLEAVSTTDSEEEISLAVYLANWNRRLWTTQEGMLAKVIMLQFADKAVSNHDLEYPGVEKSIASGHCISFPHTASNSAMAEFVVLRDFLRDDLFAALGSVHKRFGPLAPTIKALQTRSTSWRSDETICFGTLIGLNLKPLQDLEEEMRNEYRLKGQPLADNEPVPDLELAKRRMPLFLSKAKVFPRDIIFNTHRRLDTEGFRWAPASFLGIPRRGFVRHGEGKPAILDKKGRGLPITGDGFIFTTDDNVPRNSSSILLITVPRSGGQSLDLTLTVVQPGDNDSSRFIWKADIKYGVILDKSLVKLAQESSEDHHRTSYPRVSQGGSGAVSSQDSGSEADGSDLLEEDDLTESGYSDDSIDSEYLDPVTTHDFASGGLAASDSEDDRDPESETYERRRDPSMPDGPEPVKKQDDYLTDELESESELGQGNKVDQRSDWRSVLRDDDRSEVNLAPKENDARVSVSEVGTYIKDGKWFIT
ncbi:hypothetical protein F5B20DRAFT_579873 [Whalleya microplaca]|nr:hypothetical protein F5B20DRAFT_579873 [Whalleya microplaca]